MYLKYRTPTEINFLITSLFNPCLFLHRRLIYIILYCTLYLLPLFVRTNTDKDSRDETIASLKAENLKLQTELNMFKKLFSASQIKKLTEPKRRLKWTVEDISKAIVHHSAGAKSYRLLLKKGYPFPAPSTLRRWLTKIKIVPGILKQVFRIVKHANLNNYQKICVISFDEMKIKASYLYDKANDETLRPYNYVQVVMLRGLFGQWKQPIFFDYDCKLTATKLFEIIQFVESSGDRIKFSLTRNYYFEIFILF